MSIRPHTRLRRTLARSVYVCPQAGACVKVCYARNGTYNFPNVKTAHVRNVERVLDDLNGWTADMLDELGRRKFRPTGDPRLPELPRDHLSRTVTDLLDRGAACVRIHDAASPQPASCGRKWRSCAPRCRSGSTSTCGPSATNAWSST
jgi:Gene product 88